MSARPGPGGGCWATGIPTAISLRGSQRNRRQSELVHEPSASVL